MCVMCVCNNFAALYWGSVLLKHSCCKCNAISQDLQKANRTEISPIGHGDPRDSIVALGSERGAVPRRTLYVNTAILYCIRIHVMMMYINMMTFIMPPTSTGRVIMK